MKDFNYVDKEIVKKKLEYQEYAVQRQNQLLGNNFTEMKEILSSMKQKADQLFTEKKFTEAIESYMKGKVVFFF